MEWFPSFYIKFSVKEERDTQKAKETQWWAISIIPSLEQEDSRPAQDYTVRHRSERMLERAWAEWGCTRKLTKGRIRGKMERPG